MDPDSGEEMTDQMIEAWHLHHTQCHTMRLSKLVTVEHLPTSQSLKYTCWVAFVISLGELLMWTHCEGLAIVV